MVNLLQQQLRQMVEEATSKDETIAALTKKTEQLYEVPSKKTPNP